MLSLRGSILLSAFFHAALFLALLLVSGAGHARAVYKPQYQVRLVRPQEVPSLGKPQAKEAAKPKPAPPEVAKPEPKQVVLPAKKEAPPPEKKVQKPPVQKKEPAKEAQKQPAPKAAPAEKPREPAPEEVLEEALARIKKRAGSRQTIASNLPEGTSSGWEEKQKEFEYSAYYDKVERAVRENWIPPQNINLKEQSAMTVVSLTLLPDGRVLKSYIEETSGNAHFDQSVMRAILKSTPFPPPPIGLKQSHFELGLRFHSTPQTP